jgi:hypothetical protein
MEGHRTGTSYKARRRSENDLRGSATGRFITVLRGLLMTLTGLNISKLASMGWAVSLGLHEAVAVVAPNRFEPSWLIIQILRKGMDCY